MLWFSRWFLPRSARRVGDRSEQLDRTVGVPFEVEAVALSSFHRQKQQHFLRYISYITPARWAPPSYVSIVKWWIVFPLEEASTFRLRYLHFQYRIYRFCIPRFSDRWWRWCKLRRRIFCLIHSEATCFIECVECAESTAHSAVVAWAKPEFSWMHQRAFPAPFALVTNDSFMKILKFPRSE